ncbi:MAG TPA: DUF5723 family protein [Bacteroidia bacterium]|jgi:outer membrane protein OmpA-like peptidoglycan-associated protein|nr:DUF5723 family protein [Bacteroidia bacterium]
MKKILFSALLAVSMPFFSNAQVFSDIANSNYAGVYGVDFNPSCIADNRMKLDINLFGMGFNLQNNYAGMSQTAFNGHSALGAMMHAKDTTVWKNFNDSNFQNDYMTTRQTDDIKSAIIEARVVLPLSFMISLNQKSSISITGEFRSITNIDGFETPLANLIYNDFKDSSLWMKSFSNDHASAQFMTWHEVGFDYARVLKDDQTNFIKIGIRPKLELGLGSMYFYADHLEYQPVNHDTVTILGSGVQYGHSTNFDFPNGQGDSSAFNYNFQGIFAHPGIGLDLGFTYEWRPDYAKYKYDMDGQTNLWMRSKSKYKLKVGVALTDIGSIKFDRAANSGDFSGGLDHWYFRGVKLHDTVPNNVDYPMQILDDTLRSRFTFNQTSPTYNVNLPTALRGDVDYQIWKDFYVDMNFALAMQWKKNPNKVHELSYIAVTPRYDYKWAGVMLPLSYDQYKNFNVGVCIRTGPLFFGTSSLGAMLGKSKTIYGASFYFGTHVPIHYREPKDRDKDKVSNKMDKCIDVPGVWEFLGCPDRDGDHVQDAEDVCPDVPGLQKFNGCPDKDGDGIVDQQDACPDDPGLPQFNGCPDKDGDGIIDKDDDCPDEPGLPAFKGCPDKDGDGVMDKVDLCPEKPGPVDNEGCPEVRLALVDLAGQSLNSVRQAKDGSFTFESLPKDSLCVFRLDGDPDKTMGVNEVKVIVNGLAKRAIRSQADGLFRFEIPKPVGNGLTQVDVKDVAVTLNPTEMAIVKKAFDNLEFETGKDIIRPSSDSALDALAGLLIKHPEWGLKISGHTDNVGQPAANLLLSKKRASAVKSYLISKGVPANHLRTEWYGQTQPIAPNTTPEGRQKNRRVEMLIVDYYKGMDATFVPAKTTTAVKPKPKTTTH